MERQERSVQVEDGLFVSTLWAVPPAYCSKAGTALILAHGAGADMNHEFMIDFQKRLTEEGHLTVLFNFPYKEKGRRAPDRIPRLEATFRAVIERLRESRLNPTRLFIGGKSMGGRIASYIAASGNDLDGLVFLGYPLHPPGCPDRLRSSHWQDIEAPALFVQGTRDALCDLDLLGHELSGWRGPTTLYIVEGGDHSFTTLKRLGRTNEDVRSEISEAIANWLNEV